MVDRPPGMARSRALTLLAVATLMTMSVWFSASFVVAALTDRWGLTPAGASLLTIAVQVGFIVGALGSAMTGLADALPGRRLMAIGAAGAAVANLGLVLAGSVAAVVGFRLLTGAALALVYPPALKEVATWYRQGRGLALGVMIGALTVGSALPHLVLTISGIRWQAVVVATSGLSAVGAAIALSLRHSGPYQFAHSRFRLGEAMRSLRVKAVALADIGYVGHMWELYAMWAWIGAFIGSVRPFADRGSGDGPGADVVAFVVIGIGALGCLAGGRLSDRRGRAYAALVSLLCSGSCALALVFSAHYPPWLTIAICLVWGFSVIADSAQFSAIVTEHAVQDFVGSALSAQLAIGYATTIVTIYLVPNLAIGHSWGVAFGVLAIGPAFGAVAMWRLHAAVTVTPVCG